MGVDLPKRISHIDFENRAFSLDDMREIGKRTSLVTLGFKDCPISDEHIRELGCLPKLWRIWLEGTKVTDACLEYLAKYPSLTWIILDRTAVTGAGFRFLHGHSKINNIWAAETRLTDGTARHVLGIPKLANLGLTGTAVTFDGLMKLAVHPTLQPAGSQFTPEQIAVFAMEQRRLAKGTGTVVPTDAEEARRVLFAFLAAMDDWERWMATTEDSEPDTEQELMAQSKEQKARCAAIFRQFCTDKPREYGRPNALSYSKPPGNMKQAVFDIEQPSKRKIVIYTKEVDGSQNRYTLVKKGDRWLVDHKECRLADWSRDYL